jgi:hypothetical protein
MIYHWFDTVPNTTGELLRYLDRADLELRSEIVGPSNGEDPSGEKIIKARQEAAEYQHIITGYLNQGLLQEAHDRLELLARLHQKFPAVQVAAGNAIDLGQVAKLYWQNKDQADGALLPMPSWIHYADRVFPNISSGKVFWNRRTLSF